MIKRLGGLLLEDIADAHTVTHIIASDGKDSTLKRTPKLMIGICMTKNIVTKEWLLKSSKAGAPLPCDKFLVLHDTEAEKKYEFSMRQTLKRISNNLEKHASLLGGRSVFVCKGVAGNKAPSENELRMIIGAAGGTWLASLSAATIKDIDASRILLITSDPEQKKQVSPKPVANALRNGAAKCTTSFLFHAIMLQELKLS